MRLSLDSREGDSGWASDAVVGCNCIATTPLPDCIQRSDILQSLPATLKSFSDRVHGQAVKPMDEQRIIERYAYCLCLHVRPGSIFIGVINLAQSLLHGIVFLIALIHQHAQDETKGPTGTGRAATSSLAVVIYMMCAAVSAMLLFGVVKSRPSYLMPFFWIRLCDFFFSLPAFLSSLYANPAYASHWEQAHRATPNDFMDMRRVWPPGTSGSQSLLFATCIVLFKGYFLCVVWKCYRYLKMREMILPLTMSFPASVIGADVAMPRGFVPPPPAATITLSPPDYETATKCSSAPPDYETAMRQQDLKDPNSPVTESVMPTSPSSSSASGRSDLTLGSQTAATDVTLTADADCRVAHGHSDLNPSHVAVAAGRRRSSVVLVESVVTGDVEKGEA